LEKRRIPRHVDGRIKILTIPFKSFIFKVFPICTIILILMFSYFNPIVFVIGGLSVMITVVLHCELNNKETTLDMLKQLVKYQIEGDKYFERSGSNDTSNSKRCIRNKITKQEN
jgi:hypothetical protein